MISSKYGDFLFLQCADLVSVGYLGLPVLALSHTGFKATTGVKQQPGIPEDRPGIFSSPLGAANVTLLDNVPDLNRVDYRTNPLLLI